MSYLNISQQQILRSVPRKLELRNIKTSGREQKGDFYLDEKFQFTVTLPNSHGGSGSISPLFLKNLRESVRLSARQYHELVSCTLDTEGYKNVIRDQIGNAA